MSEYIFLSHLWLPSPFHFGVSQGKVWCFGLALVGQYSALFLLPGCLQESNIPTLVMNSYWQHQSLEQVHLASHLNECQGKQRCLRMVCWVGVFSLYFSFLFGDASFLNVECTEVACTLVYGNKHIQLEGVTQGATLGSSALLKGASAAPSRWSGTSPATSAHWRPTCCGALPFSVYFVSCF